MGKPGFQTHKHSNTTIKDKCLLSALHKLGNVPERSQRIHTQFSMVVHFSLVLDQNSGRTKRPIFGKTGWVAQKGGRGSSQFCPAIQAFSRPLTGTHFSRNIWPMLPTPNHTIIILSQFGLQHRKPTNNKKQLRDTNLTSTSWIQTCIPS